MLTLGVFLVGLAGSMLIGWFYLPSLAYVKKEQPVDFRHEFHGEEVGLTCDTCHFFYEDGSWAGIPSIEICKDCHMEVLGDSPQEEAFVNEYVRKNKEVKWALYFTQPECVSFSHSSHVRMAKIACETCHGPQGLSKHPAEYLTNRITNYSYVVYDPKVPLNVATIVGRKGKDVWGTVRMNECAECHRSMGKSTACFICHK